MGYYTNIEEVVARLPQDVAITAVSIPNMTQVTTWIAQTEATVDVALSAGGETSPATNAAQMSALALLCAGQVAYLVMERRSGSKVEGSSSWAQYNKDFLAALDLIRDGEFIAPSGTTGSPRAYTTATPVVTNDQRL